MFVSKHGGQSEIVLRVKQGDNPSFGFLMPDHHLHAYFRFLVDHQELLEFDIDGKPQKDDKTVDIEHDRTDDVGGGALSLLGSVYGSGEDEDGAAEDASESKENMSGEQFDAASAMVSHGLEKVEFSVNAVVKDEAVSKHPLPSKEKVPALRRNSVISAPKSGSKSSAKKENDSFSPLSAAADKSQASVLPATSKIEPLIVEPPSELKKLVDKIVEFIMRNGKQFEAVLVEQDSKHGRFPFLLPSNQYHPYYLKVLQKAQESKLTGKSFLSGKNDSVGHMPDKKTNLSKESETLSLGSADCDVPYDSDRKEKFKMVFGKSKKDGQDSSSKATQQQFRVSVDAAAVAAILQAAARGIKNPNLGILSSTSLNSNSHGHGSEDGLASSLGSLPSSHPEGITQKSNKNGERNVSVPVAKAIAKTAALEAASEADSSEAHLTREEKLKAERLKRAKMFVAMLKSGAAPFQTEPSRGLSAEPQQSWVSGSGAEINLAAKEREGSSAPLDVDYSEKNEKSERKISGDDYNERRSRRKYRSRSRRHEEEEEGEDDDDGEEREHKHLRKKHRSRRSAHEDDYKEERDEEERDNKHSSKKHRSRHSSHEDDDEEEKDEDEMDSKHYRTKHRSYRSSDEDNEEKYEDERDHKPSRKKHRSHRSSAEEEEEIEKEEDGDHKHSRKKHRSHRSSHRSRDRYKHRKRHSSSKDRESRYWHKHDGSSDKHGKRSLSEREELEEGEISSKISDQSKGSRGGGASREASVDLSSSHQDQRASCQPSETTEVSDDLRAKIRAMLMATL